MACRFASCRVERSRFAWITGSTTGARPCISGSTDTTESHSPGHGRSVWMPSGRLAKDDRPRLRSSETDGARKRRRVLASSVRGGSQQRRWRTAPGPCGVISMNGIFCPCGAIVSCLRSPLTIQKRSCQGCRTRCSATAIHARDILKQIYAFAILHGERVAKAWELIEEIEALGGMTKAVATGMPKRMLEEAATHRQAAVDAGRRSDRRRQQIPLGERGPPRNPQHRQCRGTTCADQAHLRKPSACVVPTTSQPR